MTQDAGSLAGHERLGLLVVGMHRSGTSAATRIISLLGPELPSNLMPASAEFNAAGFWESLDVVALNEKLLAAAQSSWDDVLPIDPASLPHDVLEVFRHDAAAILRSEFGDTGWFVLKDPRIGRLLKPWLEAVRSMGARPMVVVPVRHPAEVAASLRRREGFSDDKAFYLWVRHLVDLLRSSRGETRAVMIYDELMADWRGTMQRLEQDLGIRWPRSLQEVASTADQFLDGSLRHHRASTAAAPASLVGRLAFELYDALLQRSSGLDALADSIDRQLAPSEALFASIQRDAVRRLASVHAAHAQQLQQAREAYDRLARDFDDKVRHVEALELDKADLEGQRNRAVARIQELEDALEEARLGIARIDTALS